MTIKAAGRPPAICSRPSPRWCKAQNDQDLDSRHTNKPERPCWCLPPKGMRDRALDDPQFGELWPGPPGVTEIL